MTLRLPGSGVFLLGLLLSLGAVGPQGAWAVDDLTPREVALLAELEATLAGQQRQLDVQREALTQTTDPAARQALQATIDAIQQDIAELTRLRDALQAPVPSVVSPSSPAAQAADTLQRQWDKQERTAETIHDDRPPTSP